MYGRPLSQLDEVDWRAESGNGDTDAIPALLRTIATDVVARDRAWFELCDIVHHQGDIHESTALVTAFLVGMIEAAPPVLRLQILELLAELAESTSGMSGSAPAAGLRARLGDAAPLFVSILERGAPEERESCILIFGHLHETRAVAVEVLRRAIASEPAPRIAACAIWAVANLEDEADLDLFAQRFEAAEDVAVRAVCGAAIVRQRGDGAEEKHVRAVADGLAERLDEALPIPCDFLSSSLDGSPLGGQLLQLVRTGRYGAPRYGGRAGAPE